MVALNVRLSVGSLARGRSCGRLYAVALYGRLTRYLVRFYYSLYAANTPVLQTTSPMVGCSLIRVTSLHHYKLASRRSGVCTITECIQGKAGQILGQLSVLSGP